MGRLPHGPARSDTIRPLPGVPVAGIAVGYLLLYLGGAWWGSQLAGASGTTPWYPPPGLTVALVVAFGVRFAALAVLAEAAGSLVVFDIAGDFTAVQIVVNALIIAAAYTVGPAILRRVAGNGPDLRRPATYWLFLVTCVLLGPFLAATGGVAVREWAGATGGVGYWDSVRTWFTGDALGVITVAPLGLVLLLERVRVRRLLDRSTILQSLALVATPAATILLDGNGTPRFVYLCLIPLAWIAHHHGLVGATLAAAALNVEVVVLSELTLTTAQLEDLQGLMGVIALTGLILGSLASEGRRARRRIADARASDPVTGLASRSRLLTWLSDELVAAPAAVGPALVMLDIDRFSLVNDVRGHDAGDELLRRAGERIAATIRHDGRCARFGSDEFAVLLSRPQAGLADRTAARMVEAMGRPFDVGGEPISIRAHAGIAVARNGDVAGDLVRGACLALQRAADDKREVVVLDEALREQNHHSHVLESDLHGAIARRELTVAYQPIIWVEDEGRETYEALLRWNHRRYGGVPPEVIVDLAQRSGLISQVSRFVLAASCSQIAAWGAVGRRVDVHVNIAPADLLLSDIADHATAIVDASGVERSQITFELTEETAIDDLKHAETVLRALRDREFGLAIDDFGTGFASLTYLERLPVDVIKLDRLFIASLTGSSRSDAILQAIVPLAHALGLRVVAEGVETPEQLDLLTDLGCDAIQGFLLGPPRPPAVRPGTASPARTRSGGPSSREP